MAATCPRCGERPVRVLASGQEALICAECKAERRALKGVTGFVSDKVAGRTAETPQAKAKRVAERESANRAYADLVVSALASVTAKAGKHAEALVPVSVTKVLNKVAKPLPHEQTSHPRSLVVEAGHAPMSRIEFTSVAARDAFVDACDEAMPV